MPAPRPSAAPGFSLVELLIVVVILGITAGAALPLLSSANPARIELAVAEVVTALDFARTEALRTGTLYGVRFGTADQRLRVFKIDTSTGMPVEDYSVRHPVSRQIYDLPLQARTGARIAGAYFLYANLASDSAVTFDARGIPGDKPSNPSYLRLVAGWVDVSLGAETRRVTVAAETGEIAKP